MQVYVLFIIDIVIIIVLVANNSSKGLQELGKGDTHTHLSVTVKRFATLVAHPPLCAGRSVPHFQAIILYYFIKYSYSFLPNPNRLSIQHKL
jgi:hypothetical protein